MRATKVTIMLVGVKIVTNTSKKLLAVLVRLKIYLPYDPTIPTPRYIPKIDDCLYLTITVYENVYINA